MKCVKLSGKFLKITKFLMGCYTTIDYYDGILLSCHVRVSEWIDTLLY